MISGGIAKQPNPVALARPVIIRSDAIPTFQKLQDKAPSTDCTAKNMPIYCDCTLVQAFLFHVKKFGEGVYSLKKKKEYRGNLLVT